MKALRLLLWLWAPWALKWSRANITTSLGTYMVTGSVYQDVLPTLALSTGKLIDKVTLKTGNPRAGEMVGECGRRCISTPSCRSFALHPESERCLLSALDRCQSPDFLQAAPGYIYYDVRSDNSLTCWDTCMAANGTCHKCGLVHCHGSRCDQCAGTCWETPRPVFANTWLWTEHKKLFWTSCDGPWQLLWPLPGASVTPAGQDLVLRVVLKFKDKQTLTMHFSSVVLKGNFLSVGESSDGLDAASWWGAPFDQRTLSSGGNCRKFFYPPAERCRANGVLTVDEQLELYNATLDKGYAWLTGDDELDRTEISAVELWMKPVD